MIAKNEQSTPQSVEPREDLDRLVERFLQDLQGQETSPRTRVSYRLDLLHFSGWFARTVGEAFTPTDVREYRGYLLNVERRQPVTVRRRAWPRSSPRRTLRESRQHLERAVEKLEQEASTR